jgi:putative ABC transport system permease protein
MSALTQLFKVLMMNFRSMPQRWISSLVAIAGIAGVVAVFVTVLSIANGLKQTITQGGSDDVLVILRAAAGSELNSSLLTNEINDISQLAGIEKNSNNEPILSAELFVIVDMKKKSTGLDANMPLRGVTETAFSMRPNFKITQGRMFTVGLNEIIVGKSIMGNYEGLELGNEIKWGKNIWKIVGVFDDQGSMAESEIWTDVRVLQSAYNRNAYTSARVKIKNPDDISTIKETVEKDPKLSLSVKSEREFLSEQTEIMNVVINVIGTILAVLMGIAASFGAINTMYTAVSARSQEIATLRAIGFKRSSIVFSVLSESLLLGLLGGILGGALAYLFFNGFKVSTLSWSSFTQVAFTFQVSSDLLITGITVALIIGLIGGLLPSIRAARLPISQALREL